MLIKEHLPEQSPGMKDPTKFTKTHFDYIFKMMRKRLLNNDDFLDELADVLDGLPP
jgi:hypothetical protein